MRLALDTASRLMSLALHDGQRLLAEQTLYTENQHTTTLTALIENVLKSLNLSPDAMTGIAISQGPGSFSGLRVGFGVAKGLCTALDIPLIGVPTLDIVAAGSPLMGERLMAVIPAGRRRIIAGSYHRNDDQWTAAGIPENTTYEALIEGLKIPTLIHGEIDPESRSLLESAANVHLLGSEWGLRRAGFLAALSWGITPQSPAAVNPIYLKEP